MAVFNRLLFAQIKIAMLSWLVVTAFMVIARFFVPVDAAFSAIAYTVIGFGLYGALLGPKIYFAHGRYLSVFKATSKNNKVFWVRILLQNSILLFLALFVAIFFIVVSKIKLPEDDLRTLPLLFSSSGIACVSVLAFIFLCYMDCNPTFEKMNRGTLSASTQFKLLFVLMIGFGVLFGLSYVYKEFSPFLALFLSGICLLIVGVMFGDQSVKTLTRKNKIKAGALGLVALVASFVAIGFYEYRLSSKSQFLLVDRADWKYEDIKNVTSVDDWIIWQNRVGSMDVLTTDQLIEMYEKLNQYCPPFRRDTALRFACHGTPGYKDYQYTGREARSEKDVIKLLESSTEYGQVIGLMYARRLKKPLSKEVIVAIERLSEKDSSIQTLARNTMTESYSQDFRYGFELFTIKPE